MHFQWQVIAQGLWSWSWRPCGSREKYNFTIGRGQIFNRLGIIYRSAGDFSSALFIINSQCSCSTHLIITIWRYRQKYILEWPITDWMNWTRLYFTPAWQKNIKRYGDEIMSCPNLITLGRIQLDKGNVQPALNYFSTKPVGWLFNRSIFFTSTANLEIAEIYQQAGPRDSCIYYAQRALDDAQKMAVVFQLLRSVFFVFAIRKTTLNLHFVTTKWQWQL